MDIPSVSFDDTGRAETLANVLPNEILLNIFHFLDYKDLISAEQVCWHWKTIVETCFATKKRLSLCTGSHEYLKLMKRYGSSIQTLSFWLDESCLHANWTEEIAHCFPHLITLELWYIRITAGDFKCLSTKCCQLNNVSLRACDFSDKGLRIFLQALPGIKVLNIIRDEHPYEPRNLDLASTVFSICRNLHQLEMSGDGFEYKDTAKFFSFCKECVTLRRLAIRFSNMPKDMFAQIQHCSLLEELILHSCQFVDDSTLIAISKGCPNLRSLHLAQLSSTSDVGLKSFARCRNLNSFVTYHETMTDATLVELSKCVNLRKMKVSSCPLVSDRGCAALLAHCPRLELLDVGCCKEVSNATVDSAIEAVECRQNGLVLELKISGRCITPQRYENCHPLLRLKT